MTNNPSTATQLPSKRVVALAAPLLVIATIAGAGIVGAAGDTTVSLSPADTTAAPGDTVTYEVVVEDADGGVGAHATTVSVANPDIAEITDVELLGNPGQQDVTIADDGSHAQIDAALMDTADTGSVTIARIEVTVRKSGSTAIDLSVDALGDEDGFSYSTTGTNNASLTGSGPDFEITALDVTPTTGEDPLTVTATATVKNTGGASGTEPIDLYVNDDSVASEDVSLAPGASTDITFEHTLPGPGDWTVTVNDHTPETVTVTEPLALEYSTLSVDPTADTDSLTFTASTTIENVGGPGTATIPFLVDGDQVDTETRDLNAGETATIAFEYTLTDSGKYNVTIGDLAPETVTVNAPPAAALAANETTIGVDANVTLDASESTVDAGIDRYEWDVDGDGSSDEVTDTATLVTSFSEAGNHTVRVTVVDEFGTTASAEVMITVRAEPDASFRVDVDTTPDDTADGDIEAGGNITINGSTAAAQPGVHVTWDLRLPTRNVTSSEAILDYQIEQPGDIEVTLVVEDDAGQQNASTRTLTAVDTTPPTVELTTSRADDAFPRVSEANPLTIELTAEDPRHDQTRLEVRNDSGGVVYGVDVSQETGDGESYTLEWNAVTNDSAPVDSGTYVVAAQSVDTAGNIEEVQMTHDVDTTPPSVTVVDIQGGVQQNGRRYVNDSLTITVEADDGRPAAGAVSTVDVQLQAGFTTYRYTADASPVEDATNRWDVTIDLSELPDEGPFTIHGIAVDPAKNTNTTNADTTLVYDETPPALGAVLDLNETTSEGTVTVRANEPLETPPAVIVESETATTTVSMTAVDGANRWTGTFDLESTGEYRVVTNGTDLAGNTGSATTVSTVEYVNTTNGTATVLNKDTGTFIEFSTESDVTNSLVTISESDLPPEALPETRRGIDFLTTELGETLDANLTNATIYLPVDESKLPGGISPEDASITHYNETTSRWETVDTAVVQVDRKFDADGESHSVSGEYWTTTVEDFSTYGTTVTDDEPPELTEVSPTTETVAWDQDTVDVTFQYTDDLTGVNTSAIGVYIDGANVTTATATQITSESATHTLDLEPGRSYTASAVVVDEAGNENEFTTTITVEDPPAPEITDVSVSDGESFAPGTETVSLEFAYDTPGLALDADATELRVNGQPVDATINPDSVAYELDVANDTTYDVELSLRDEWPHTVERTLTFEVEAPEADETESGEVADDGGGGGGGGGATLGGVDVRSESRGYGFFTAIKSIGEDEVDVDVELEGSGVMLTELTVDARFKPDQITINLYTPTEEPTDSPALADAEPVAYFRMELRHAQPKNIRDVELSFTVDEAALPSDTDPDRVTLYRFTDGEWIALDTHHITGMAFRAVTPGFSEFAIGIASTETDQQSADDNTDTTTTTTTGTLTTTTTRTQTPPATTTETTTSTESLLPGFDVFIAVVALLVISLLGIRRAEI